MKRKLILVSLCLVLGLTGAVLGQVKKPEDLTFPPLSLNLLTRGSFG